MRRWPDLLPQGSSEDYRVTPVDQTRRTTMETGARRVRRLSRAPLDVVEAGWRLYDEEMALFRAWWGDEPWSLAGASDDLTGWSPGNAVAVPGPLGGPDACPTTRMWETSATGEHVLSRTPSRPVADGAVLVATATMRGVSRTQGQISLRQKDGATMRWAAFDLANGTLISTSPQATGSIVPRGDGWWRCTLVTAVGAGAAMPLLRVQALSGGTNLYAGSPSAGLDLCEVMAREQTGADLFGRTGADGQLLGAAGGTAWVLIPLPFGGGLRVAEARFAEPFAASTLAGPRWEVRAVLEVRHA
jgi:hypothetical protein